MAEALRDFFRVFYLEKISMKAIFRTYMPLAKTLYKLL